jgi:hypothetical protein
MDYGAMHSTYRYHTMDQFFVIKVQMIDPTVQNDFIMNI